MNPILLVGRSRSLGRALGPLPFNLKNMGHPLSLAHAQKVHVYPFVRVPSVHGFLSKLSKTSKHAKICLEWQCC